MAGNKGFTLIEMMVVLAVSGLIAGIAAFSIRYSGGNAFTVEKARMVEALTLARNTASLRAECVRVTIVDNIYSAETYAASAGRLCNGPFSSPVKTLDTINFADHGITIGPLNTGGTTIVFNTTGGLASDRMTTFSMSDEHQERTNIRIFPAIGQIRAQ